MCDHCQRRYPIVDGVALVAGDVEAHRSKWGAELVDGEPAALAEHLSIYLDAHWGDRAVPVEELGMAAAAHKLAERATQKVERAVELGCGPGRGLHELAKGAQDVVGVDAQLAAVATRAATSSTAKRSSTGAASSGATTCRRASRRRRRRT